LNFFEELDRRTAEQAWADFCQLDPESKEQFVKQLIMDWEKLNRVNDGLVRLSQEMSVLVEEMKLKLLGLSAEEIKQYLRKES
jgi:hypothetical protein